MSDTQPDQGLATALLDSASSPGSTSPIPPTRCRSSLAPPTRVQPRLVIRSSAKPAKPTLSNVVLVERHEDQAGKWNLSLHPAGPEVRRGLPAAR